MIQQTLIFKKYTKTKLVYMNEPEQKDAPVTLFYIDKSAYGNKLPPQKIAIEIKEV